MSKENTIRRLLTELEKWITHSRNTRFLWLGKRLRSAKNHLFGGDLEKRLCLCGCCNSSHEMPGLITFNGGWALGAAACSGCIWSSWTTRWARLHPQSSARDCFIILRFIAPTLCIIRSVQSSVQNFPDFSKISPWTLWLLCIYNSFQSESSTFVCYDRWIRLNQNVENHQFSN